MIINSVFFFEIYWGGHFFILSPTLSEGKGVFSVEKN
jgi:hypothetical protein